MRFVLARKKDAAAIYETLLGLDGTWEVEVKPFVEKKRRAQENLYRQWCRIIASQTGNNAEYLHKYFAKRFLGTERNTIYFPWKGEEIPREVEDICSTTKLTVKEMSQYMTDVEVFAAETLGITLPQPE